MISLSGIRNALCCVVAFAIVACASAPMPVEKMATAARLADRADVVAQLAESTPAPSNRKSS